MTTAHAHAYELNLPLEAMPASLRELVRVLGQADALRLVGMHQGGRIYVPSAVDARHHLAALLGMDAFTKLVKEYRGEELQMPKLDRYLQELRHEHVRQCRAQGLTMEEIAGATGYSRRHVINILGGLADGARADVHTRDLFDSAPAAPLSYAGQANDPFGLGRRA